MRQTAIGFFVIGLLASAGCGTSSTPGGKIEFSASGEVLALDGYAFPPASADDGFFVDGWTVHFSKFLAVIDHIKLSDNPDTSPTDQSQTGKLIAQLDGPWAIDLHQGGPLPGKGGGDEQAYPIITLDNQNKNGNAPFDPTVRYAFGFDLVPATASATFLQLHAGDPDYQEMIANSWNILYVGTATWTGGSSCTTTNPSFDFTKLPQTVNFRFGFKTPTTYINCQNPDNDPAQGFPGEDHQRGIQIKSNATVIGQVTVHTDHPFWESFVHDTPAHFDQLAALAVHDTDGSRCGTAGNPATPGYCVLLDDTTGVNYTAFAYDGTALPWRSCTSYYTPPNTNTQMGFDSLTIPYDPYGSATTSMRDYHDYMSYDQSTQGHLNSDGLCFVSRNYPSPP